MENNRKSKLYLSYGKERNFLHKKLCKIMGFKKITFKGNYSPTEKFLTIFRVQKQKMEYTFNKKQ